MSTNGTQEQNRNRSRNQNRNRNRGRGPQGNNPKGNNPNPRPQSQHQSFVSRKPAPLTFWQKLMKFIGLYKEPTAPTRPQQPQRSNDGGNRSQNSQAKEPRSNTRDARDPRREKSSEPRPPRERRPAPSGDVESTRLYIGNLSYDANESDIEDLFKGVGPVRSVEIVYNKHTHKSKGYGFVEMLRIDEAKRAVEILHDQPFMGRNLIVSGAKPKDDSAPRDHDAAREASNQQASDEAEEPAVVEEVHSLTGDDAQKETFA